MKGKGLHPSGMIWLIIGINLGISWGCWRLVGILVGLRRTLVGVTRSIEGAERATHDLLRGAPAAIRAGQTGTRSLRQQIPRFTRYWRQFQQILTILLWCQRRLKTFSSQTKGNRRP